MPLCVLHGFQEFGSQFRHDGIAVAFEAHYAPFCRRVRVDLIFRYAFTPATHQEGG
jgi:hypothetical protein